MCNKRFNSTEDRSEANVLIRDLLNQNYKFKCTTPCETNQYTTKQIHRETHDLPYTEVRIVFDKKVAVVHTRFVNGIEEILIGLGGQISSGQTLLWVLLTILAVPQVTLNLMVIFLF